MKRIALFLFLILSVITCFAQTQIDPTYQIKWNALAYPGTPDANGITCTQNGNYTVYPYGAEWGQSYQDTTNNVEYRCTTYGWVKNLPTTGGTLTGALNGTSASFAGTVAAGAVNSVYNAAAYSGGDCGAKINNAVTQLSGVAAEIDVTLACGTTWTTPVVLTQGHNLKWTQGGAYVLAPANIALGNNVIDMGAATVQLAAQAGGTAGSTVATSPMWNLTDGTTVASNVKFIGGTVDGNYVNQTAPCDHFWTCVAFVNVQGTTTTAPSNITVKNVVMQNWLGVPVTIHGYGETLPFPLSIYILDSTCNHTGLGCVGWSGLASGLTVSRNIITNWANLSLNTYSGVGGYENNGLSAGKDIIITDNKFLNTSATEYAVELYASSVGGIYSGVTISNNLFDAGGNVGGGGISASMIGSVVANNNHINGGSGCGARCGDELNVQNSAVVGNTIINGGIAVGGSSLYQSFDNTVSGNQITASGVNSVGISVSGFSATGPQNNTIVTGNSIDISNASGNCVGIGTVYATLSQLTNVTISGNTIVGPGTSACYGVRIATEASPQSNNINISGNTITGVFTGIGDSQGDSSATDITISGNALRNTATPININLLNAVVRQYGNTTSATDATQYLNGGATVSTVGQGSFPGGVANGNLSAPPSNGLTAWYTAGANCASTGVQPTTLVDSSGNGNTLTGGATNPTCEMNIINGQPVLRFVGAESGYQGPFSTTINGGDTVFVVYRKTVGASSASLYDDLQYASHNSVFFYTATSMQFQVTSALNATVADDNLVHVSASSLTSTGTGTLYLDGTQIATSSIGPANLTGFTLGARASRSASWNGDIAEVLVYNGAPTLAQIQTVGAYLAAKYALTQSGTWSVVGGRAQFGVSVTTPAISLNGGTSLTSQSSANPQLVTCPIGGTTTQYCSAAGAWTTPAAAIPVRTGAWSISAATSAPVTFTTSMSVAPTSCSVTPSASSATTGQPFPTSLLTTGFTVNVPVSGTIAGTYSCTVNNGN